MVDYDQLNLEQFAETRVWLSNMMDEHGLSAHKIHHEYIEIRALSAYIESQCWMGDALQYLSVQGNAYCVQQKLPANTASQPRFVNACFRAAVAASVANPCRQCLCLRTYFRHCVEKIDTVLQSLKTTEEEKLASKMGLVTSTFVTVHAA